MELKPSKSFADQVVQLQYHGLQIGDTQKAEEFLSAHNYYHLNKYYHNFMDNNGIFCNGCNFNQIIRIYYSDEFLRGALFRLLLAVEMKIKTVIANYMAIEYGPYVFYEYEHSEKIQDYVDNCSAMLREVGRDKKNAVVTWHNNNYDGFFPIWVIFEFASFGSVSRYYGNINQTDRAVIAKEYFNTKGSYLSSWLKSLTELRNRCAHGKHLFRVQYSSKPLLPQYLNWPCEDNDKLFAICLVLNRIANPPDWNEFMSALLQRDSSDTLNLSEYGFPSDWHQLHFTG